MIYGQLSYTSRMEMTIHEITAYLREIHIFTKLSDQQLVNAAEMIEVFSVPAGETIYKVGNKSDGFYLIYKGKVRVTVPGNKIQTEISRTLGYGDYFGEEALVYGQTRLTKVTAQNEAIVFRVSKRSLNKWIDDFPRLITPLRLVEESFFLLLNKSFPWMASGETIKYASRRTKFILWQKLLVPASILSILLTLAIYLIFSGELLLTGLAFGLLILVGPWAAWIYFDWLNDFLVVTNSRIVCLERVILLYDTRQETPLEAVQAFGIETDQWGRWFGYGSIVVRSYTGNQLLKQIQNPTEVISILEKALEQTKSYRKEEDKKAAEATVRTRLGLESTYPLEETKVAVPTFFEAGFLPTWIADFFRIRMEEGDTITYRTHWIILFKSIFLASLILMLVPTLLAVGITQQIPMFSPGTIVLISGFIWVIALLLWIYRYIDWHNDCYIITPDQIMDVYRKPLGTEERRTASLSSILGIEYSRKGLIGLLFNYGTVFIKVGDSNFTFDNVYNPSVVQQELFQKLNEHIVSEKKAAAEEERQRMADFIETYHNLHKGELDSFQRG